jgi:hypothetical protein
MGTSAAQDAIKEFYPREEVLDMDRAIAALPDIPFDEQEDVFRIECLGLEWDIGVFITQPRDEKHAMRGPDGRKTGFFLLHGGDGDFKSLSVLARQLAGKLGAKVLSMTFPGRLYLPDPARDWPGDTILADGTIRTPIWREGEIIGPDQYEVVQDQSTMNRLRYGTRTLARAKPGTIFWHRMAAWPAAFEQAMIVACERHFPPRDFAVHAHGHSTGGAFSAKLPQLVENVVGQTELETAPIGYINEVKHDWSGALGKIGGYERVATSPHRRTDAFNELYIRTWRDLARYAGPEALGQEGPTALMRLPWLMEEVLSAWEEDRIRPNFKAEYPITHNIVVSLKAAAEAVSDRLQLKSDEREKMIQKFLGFCHYETSADARPVQPIFYINSANSRDNSPEAFNGIILPMLAELKPAPRVKATQLGAGTHIYYKPMQDLPFGLTRAAAFLWRQAITDGFFML